MKNVKTRNYILLLYPDNPVHVGAMDSIESWSVQKRPMEYLSIMHHDFDLQGDEITEGEGKPHYHYVLTFENPVYRSSLAKQFGLIGDDGEPETRFIQPCKNLESSLLYLTHVQYPDKEQYSQSDLRGSRSLVRRYQSAWLRYFEKNKVDVRSALWAMRDWINHQNHEITASEVVEWLMSTPYIKYRNERLFHMMIQEHNAKMYSRQHRDLVSEYARGQIELNQRSGVSVVGSDFEISPDGWINFDYNDTD